SAPPASRTVVNPCMRHSSARRSAFAAKRLGGMYRCWSVMLPLTAQMWTWASVSPGISVAPLQSSVVTGPGSGPTLPLGRTSLMRSSSTTTAAPSTGSAPVQSMSNVLVRIVRLIAPPPWPRTSTPSRRRAATTRRGSRPRRGRAAARGTARAPRRGRAAAAQRRRRRGPRGVDAGFLEERVGARRVVRVALHRRVVDVGGRERAAHACGAALEHLLDQLLDVHGVIHRAPHAHVLHGPGLEVHEREVVD